MPEDRELTYAEALREALQLGDERRPACVPHRRRHRGVRRRLRCDRRADRRVWRSSRPRDTPISEAAIAGACLGASLTGMRPVGEIQFMDFVTLSMEQLVLQAAKVRFMFGGKATVPFVLRMPGGSGTGAAAQHSESLENWFVHVPGLKVVMPSNAYDAKGLLLAAIDDDNPVVFIEHKLLYKTKSEVPEGRYLVPLSQTKIVRPGRDLTVIATSLMVSRALEAAQQLASEGIELEVIDPRTLQPLDEQPIIELVIKTGRALVVHEAVQTGGFGGEVVARLAASQAFDYLDAPIRRLGGLDIPIPYNRLLEAHAVPQVEDMVRVARHMVQGDV